MGASELLGYLTAKGLTIRPRPDGNLEVSPRQVLTDELRAIIRARKPELLAVLQTPNQAHAPSELPTHQPSPAHRLEAYEMLLQRVLSMLEDRPETDLAVTADNEVEASSVLVAVARRGSFACVLRIDPARYDGVRLLELLERHGGSVH